MSDTQEADKDIDFEALVKNYADDPEASLDPRVVAEASTAMSEEDIVGLYSSEGGSEERLPLVESWFPKEEQWQGKTIVNSYQAKALAVAKHLPEAFNEIEELEGFINEVINDYEMLLTSVEGTSREQQMNVLMSMFGKESSEESKARSAVLSAIAGKEESDE